MSEQSDKSHDIAIVGGGPVGLVAALELARRGRRAVVFDRARPPIDKPCGEGLMPPGVEILRRLGVDASALGRHFHGIAFLENGRRLRGGLGATTGVGIRRTVLHAALVNAAVEAGVDMHWGARVTGLDAASGELQVAFTEDRVETVRARFVIGADGLHSKVRSWAGLEGRAPRRQRFGVRRHFGVVPWSEDVEVHWSNAGEAYVTPVGAEEVGIAILWSGVKSSFDELLPHFPELAGRLAGSTELSRDRGAGPLEQRVRGVQSGRVLLIGDAGGYVDAVTGEGLSLGFRDALAAVAAIVDERPAGYAHARRRIHRVPELLTRALLLAEHRPWLRRVLFAALAPRGRAFEPFAQILAVLTRVPA